MVIFVRTSTHFFIESVAKIEIVQEFKITVFEEMFYCCLQPHTTDFDKHDILHFAFWIYFPFIKTLSIETISNCPFMMILLLKFITTPKQMIFPTCNPLKSRALSCFIVNKERLVFCDACCCCTLSHVSFLLLLFQTLLLELLTF